MGRILSYVGSAEKYNILFFILIHFFIMIYIIHIYVHLSYIKDIVLFITHKTQTLIRRKFKIRYILNRIFQLEKNN